MLYRAVYLCLCFRFLFHKQFHLSNQRPKFCLVCQTKYEDENSFYEHVMFAHEQVFEHFCTQCDKSFSTDNDLTRHENTHSAQRNYECTDCGKKFIDSQTLSEHSVSFIEQRKKHEISNHTVYPCIRWCIYQRNHSNAVFAINPIRGNLGYKST